MYCVAPLLERDCAVCKESFKLNPEDPDELVVVTLPCKHPFHEGCILPWLKSSGTCPVCRFALNVSCVLMIAYNPSRIGTLWLISHNNNPLGGLLEGAPALTARIRIFHPDHAHVHPGTLMEVAVAVSSKLFSEVVLVLPVEAGRLIQHVLNPIREEVIAIFPGNGSRTSSDKNLSPVVHVWTSLYLRYFSHYPLNPQSPLYPPLAFRSVCPIPGLVFPPS